MFEFSFEFQNFFFQICDPAEAVLVIPGYNRQGRFVGPVTVAAFLATDEHILEALADNYFLVSTGRTILGRFDFWSGRGIHTNWSPFSGFGQLCL